jgi:uncharacterized protein YbcV (DUF1398 family)
MSVHNLTSYKQSIVLLPEIQDIIKVLTLTEKALSHYNYYVPASKVLATIQDQKTILQIYEKELIEVKKSKGLKV